MWDAVPNRGAGHYCLRLFLHNALDPVLCGCRAMDAGDSSAARPRGSLRGGKSGRGFGWGVGCEVHPPPRHQASLHHNRVMQWGFGAYVKRVGRVYGGGGDDRGGAGGALACSRVVSSSRGLLATLPPSTHHHHHHAQPNHLPRPSCATCACDAGRLEGTVSVDVLFGGAKSLQVHGCDRMVEPRPRPCPCPCTTPQPPVLATCVSRTCG